MSSRNNGKKNSSRSNRGGGATARISGQFEGNITASGELHIATGATCKANIRAGKVRVEGSFEGNMAAQREMSIAPSARCKGSFNANSLKVDGQIEGEAVVADRMDLSPSARMKGQIFASRLVVADGASFSGKCTIGKFAQQEGVRKAA